MFKDERIKELHSIKKFRGSNLGILRLNRLANPDKKIIIRIGEETFEPVSYDTYGHPIISEECFNYYKALKSLKERAWESLVPEVEYEVMPFVIREDVYDSKAGLEKIEKLPEEEQLKELKRLLIFRKKARFTNKVLHTFILYGKYALYEDGRVYKCTYNKIDNTVSDGMILEMSDVSEFHVLEEVHIPSEEDTCAICGKKFDINHIKTFSTAEDANCRKVHTDCLNKYIEAVEYQEASRIVDTVYLERPSSEIVREYDKKEKVWYLFHTKHGDVAIRFKNKVIVIKWFGNFKPFNFEKLFEEEEVTKRRHPDAKEIHAWSASEAIRYLMMVEKY